jgi:hypothetical protein
MINSTYGAGYRAGLASPKFTLMLNGTKVLKLPECPFPTYRFISRLLWDEGFRVGMIKKLNSGICK